VWARHHLISDRPGSGWPQSVSTNGKNGPSGSGSFRPI
jgi:hypothetical protein